MDSGSNVSSLLITEVYKSCVKGWIHCRRDLTCELKGTRSLGTINTFKERNLRWRESFLVDTGLYTAEEANFFFLISIVSKIVTRIKSIMLGTSVGSIHMKSIVIISNLNMILLGQSIIEIS